MSAPQVLRHLRHQARGLRHASSISHNSNNNIISPTRRQRLPPVLLPVQAWSPSELARMRQARLKALAKSPSKRGRGGRPPPPRSQRLSQKPRRQNEELALTIASADTSNLLADVQIADDPDAVLSLNHPAMSILGHSSLVIQRQLEMMNVIIGFEQANRYIIMDGGGKTLGYMAEQDHGMGQSMARQLFRTHRSFTTHIFDKQQREVLRIHRPFSYINSRIKIYDPVPPGGFAVTETQAATTPVVAQEPAAMSTSIMDHSVDAALTAPQTSLLKLEDMRIIGESQQQWAAFRRKYNLFSYRPVRPTPSSKADPKLLESGQKPTSDSTAVTEAKTSDVAIEKGMSQFAHIDEPLLSWDFTLRAEDNNTLGSVNRNFSGFAREIFTDTGVYALRMDSAAEHASDVQQDQAPHSAKRVVPMSLDARAVMLATAVSIDFDYFSKSSSNGMMPMPMFFPMPWGGGGGASTGTDTGAAGAAGAAGAGAMDGGASQGMFGDDIDEQQPFADDGFVEDDDHWDDFFGKSRDDGSSGSSSGGSGSGGGDVDGGSGGGDGGGGGGGGDGGSFLEAFL